MRNHGAVLLARTGQTQDAIAAEVGVSRVAVSHWMSGNKRPAAAARKILEVRYEVPAAAWDEEAPKKKTPRPKVEPPSTLPAVPRPTIPDGVLSMADELMADLRQGLDELRQDTGALPLEKARVRASLGQTLAILGKMTGAFDLGAKIFRLPIWREIEHALARGLAGHPDAAAAVAAELRRVESESGYKRP